MLNAGWIFFEFNLFIPGGCGCGWGEECAGVFFVVLGICLG